MNDPVACFTVADLAVEVHGSEADLGSAAARRAAQVLRAAVGERGHARAVIATGNSQLAFVEALRGEDVPWQAVTVFHMDEYLGLSADHPASFRRWIRERIGEPFQPASVDYINGDTAGRVAAAEVECARYEAALREAPIDLVCLGIGENGHLAFNEPFQADFDDSRWVRIVELDAKTRQQQVGEGHFAAVDDVPSTAISLTVPALLSARVVQVCAPEGRKAEAVRQTLTAPISTGFPATVLRRQSHARLFLDQDSARLLDELTVSGTASE